MSSARSLVRLSATLSFNAISAIAKISVKFAQRVTYIVNVNFPFLHAIVARSRNMNRKVVETGAKDRN